MCRQQINALYGFQCALVIYIESANRVNFVIKKI